MTLPILLILLGFFYIPSLWTMFRGRTGWGWGLLGASFFVCVFFALRLRSYLPLFPIPVLFVTALLFYLAVRLFQKREKELEVSLERLEAENNLLTETERNEQTRFPVLIRKVERYASLSELTALLSASLVLQEVAQTAVQKAFEIVGKSEGALLFLVDEGEEGLSLVSSFFGKGTPGTKSKKGDLFDHWILKQRRPLLVQDVQRDFRFTFEEAEKRDIGSLIATPLTLSDRITGILRLESPRREMYTSDDLRLLSIMGDLVASTVENARLTQRTEQLARVDELTGLYVHRFFQERFQEELARAQRSRTPLSLLMADIDHFKTYNDRYGHIAGDVVLKQVAVLLKGQVEAEDTVCRYGGEEFSIILPQRNKGEALLLAEKVRKTIAESSFLLRRETTHVTLSVGVATFPEDGLVKDELLKQVDRFLYRAKQGGRNCVCGS